jgi:SpoVK/Ycf46/Vps4 family AAA+-type ATPase
MAINAEHFKALVQRHIEGDEEAFFAIATQVAARAARAGKSEFARELRALIEAAKAPSTVPQLKPTPLIQPRGELAGLMTVSYPATSLSHMTLSADVRAKLERVIAEQRQREQLSDHGLEPIHRLLLLGPPGTGKSMSAGVLAHELRLPLFTIQLDALMSKYMGETAAKLRLVFDAVAATRAVYLFDEFDALGSERAASNDVGEARRVLNSFLQFLDASFPASLVVAATNHPQLLDKALYRRFDLVVSYDLPDAESAIAVLQKRLTLVHTRTVDWSDVAKHVEGLSQSDLVRAAEAAAKNVLLSGQAKLSTAAVKSALMERHRQSNG